MRHPFANVQYYASELRFDDTYDSEDAPSSSNEKSHVQRALDAAQVVKRSRRLAVLLGGQESGSAVPTYRPGGTVNGSLAILSPSELLSVHAVVHGYINISEIAGAGRALTEVLHEDLYSWNADSDPPLPSRIPFRYTLPSQYTVPNLGDRLPLPPTYHAYLSGIPGFTVHVSYHIAVDMLYTKRQGPSWRKRRCLRVPLQLQHFTRPAARGPFRLSSEPDAAGPRTMFRLHMPSRQTSRAQIETHVFLPQSQICSLKEPIPFFVTLFGNEATLAPFLCYVPSPASFHPLSSPSETSIDSLQRALKLRQSAATCPLRIVIQRTTAVDVDRTGVPCVEGQVGQDFASKCIGQGVIHNVSRGPKSITWAGTITVNADVTSGGFAAIGLRVSDSIVVSIKPPEVSRSRWMPLCETIAVRLTTESYGCSAAVPVSSVV
ncbi:uncharacterized protein C8Q71DRAFT_794377 [Rhodofomes roseus]|uniref:Arrestin-like N-terminal domain-containing protein n=1 Tax=Rhodofomes roseus TaxID=34475 RepID=A0ABQ8KRX6_9APHY|nr:uncharacterized protein C8Q71DRAFT_794377 [Rhodofomes roseus]KAH9841350.1 hypothetical protein C8Q71DRAFT_794377 [Rhodofomes roseus]